MIPKKSNNVFQKIFLTTKSLSLLPLLLLLNLAAVAVTGQETCDRCVFDGKDELDACKDYGLIDNSVLIGWYLGTEECMDVFDIAINSPVDSALICDSANSFVNELKFGTSLNTAKLGLGVGSSDNTGGAFYNDGPILKDEIIVDGVTYDCTINNGSECYAAMKQYFELNENGQAEMNDVCNQLVNKIANDKQLEQSILRNRLCLEYKDGVTIPDVCDPLWTQLLEQITIYAATDESDTEKACQGYSFGVQDTTEIPGCDRIQTTESTSTNGGISSSSLPIGLSAAGVVVVVVVLLVTTTMMIATTGL